MTSELLSVGYFNSSMHPIWALLAWLELCPIVACMQLCFWLRGLSVLAEEMVIPELTWWACFWWLVLMLMTFLSDDHGWVGIL